MQSPYNFKKYAVVYVDDEPMALKYFEKTFGGEFRIITAENANEGMRLIEERGEEIGILLTDQRMPGEKGVQLLERARQLRPRIVRMIITAYADLGVTVDAVNLGNIFRYISKPLQVQDMRNTLRRAMEFFLVQHERDDLLCEKLSVLQNVLITDRVISMGVLAAGLRDRFNRPLAAIEAFLQMSSNVSMAESVLSKEALNPEFWKEFHQAVIGQAGRVVAMLDEVGVALETVSKGAKQSVPEIVDAACRAESKRLEDNGLYLEKPHSADWPTEEVSPLAATIVAMMLRTECAMLAVGSRVLLNVSETEDHLVMAVSHEGQGIPVADLRAVFDPRFDAHGTGKDWGLTLLGLYLLVYHAGGDVKLTVLPGGSGARTTVKLPIAGVGGGGPDVDPGDFVARVLVNDALWSRVLSVLD